MFQVLPLKQSLFIKSNSPTSTCSSYDPHGRRMEIHATRFGSSVISVPCVVVFVGILTQHHEGKLTQTNDLYYNDVIHAPQSVFVVLRTYIDQVGAPF